MFYWRGRAKSQSKKSRWAFKWLGPATVIGREGNNVWISHRGTAIKVAVRHLRHAQPEEQIPWPDITELGTSDAANNQADDVDVELPPRDDQYLDLTGAAEPSQPSRIRRRLYGKTSPEDATRLQLHPSGGPPEEERSQQQQQQQQLQQPPLLQQQPEQAQ